MERRPSPTVVTNRKARAAPSFIGPRRQPSRVERHAETTGRALPTRSTSGTTQRPRTLHTTSGRNRCGRCLGFITDYHHRSDQPQQTSALTVVPTSRSDRRCCQLATRQGTTTGPPAIISIGVVVRHHIRSAIRTTRHPAGRRTRWCVVHQFIRCTGHMVIHSVIRADLQRCNCGATRRAVRAAERRTTPGVGLTEVGLHTSRLAASVGEGVRVPAQACPHRSTRRHPARSRQRMGGARCPQAHPHAGPIHRGHRRR